MYRFNKLKEKVNFQLVYHHLPLLDDIYNTLASKVKEGEELSLSSSQYHSISYREVKEGYAIILHSEQHNDILFEMVRREFHLYKMYETVDSVLKDVYDGEKEKKDLNSEELENFFKTYGDHLDLGSRPSLEKYFNGEAGKGNITYILSYGRLFEGSEFSSLERDLVDNINMIMTGLDLTYPLEEMNSIMDGLFKEEVEG